MPNFVYKASKENGEIVNGEISAANYEEVYKSLNDQRLMTISIDEKVDFDVKKFSEKMKDFESFFQANVLNHSSCNVIVL